MWQWCWMICQWHRAGSPWGSFSSVQLVPCSVPRMRATPGAGRLATGSGHVKSLHIRLSVRSAGRNEDRDWMEEIRCSVIWNTNHVWTRWRHSSMCLSIYPSSLQLLIGFDLFSRYSSKILSALLSVFLLLPPVFFLASMCCQCSEAFHCCGSHFSCLSSLEKSCFLLFLKSFKSPWNSEFFCNIQYELLSFLWCRILLLLWGRPAIS